MKRVADTDLCFVVVIVSLSFIDSIFDELCFCVMVCFGVEAAVANAGIATFPTGSDTYSVFQASEEACLLLS